MNHKELNKTLKKTNRELRAEVHDLKDRCKGFIEPDNILAAGADPRP